MMCKHCDHVWNLTEWVLFFTLEASGLGVFKSVLKIFTQSERLGTEFTGKLAKMLAIRIPIASFQTSAHASGRPCSGARVRNELNNDTGDALRAAVQPGFAIDL